MAAFADNLMVNQVALCALNKCWSGGLPPLDRAAAPTQRIVVAVVDAMRRHAACHLVQQAGLRLLKLHAASGNRLVEAPAVLAATVAAMRRHADDETVRIWGPETLCLLNAVPAAAWISAHGAPSHATLRERSLQLARAAPRPTRLYAGDTPWYVAIAQLCEPTPEPAPPSRGGLA